MYKFVTLLLVYLVLVICSGARHRVKFRRLYPQVEIISPRLTPQETEKLRREIEEDIRRKAKEYNMTEDEYYMRAV